MAFNQDKESHDLSAFYKLIKRVGTNPQDATITSNIFNNFYHVTEEESKRVLENKQTIDQAMENIQSRLQEGLDKAKRSEPGNSHRDIHLPS